MSTTERKSVSHKYLFKASWGGTALKFWIDAVNKKQAQKRAERYVFLMEGGPTCLELTLETMK